MNEDELWNGVKEQALRKRDGYTSCCAFIDLLGMNDLILSDMEEAQLRIDALHQGVVNALDIYPGLEGCRATFFGDSVVLIKEIPPEDNLSDIYPVFCGNIYCINTLLLKVDLGLGSVGIRTFVSHGKLIPLTSPSAWHEDHLNKITKEWRVLTGVNEAFAKCCKADEIGSKGGFTHNKFWVESLDDPLSYKGIDLKSLPHEYYKNETAYPALYNDFFEEGFGEKADLKFKKWDVE